LVQDGRILAPQDDERTGWLVERQVEARLRVAARRAHQDTLLDRAVLRDRGTLQGVGRWIQADVIAEGAERPGPTAPEGPVGRQRRLLRDGRRRSRRGRRRGRVVRASGQRRETEHRGGEQGAEAAWRHGQALRLITSIRLI